MFKNLKKLIALDNPFRLLYHKIKAIIANLFYFFPSKKMIIVGVTGTNGKTTTCNIIARGLKEAGNKVFMFSTVNIIIGDEEYTNETKMTSPDAFELQRLLKIAKDKGCNIAVIETASHGIKMHRIWGINYDVLVLTNITQDHLDLHKTMDDYVQTKLKIFRDLIISERKTGVKKTAVINAESNYADLFLNETYDNLYKYGFYGNADIKASNLINTPNGMEFDVQIAGKIIHIETKLRGDYNVENLLAAICVFISFGIKLSQIQKIIKNIKGVPGRMEELENVFGYKIFIDYAHTPDALEKVLMNLKEIVSKENKIITIFGATGDRDKTKRPIMGEIVSRLSDKVIVTQDDDYTENTQNIIKDILPGIERKEGEDFWIIPSREDAIRTGIITAKEGDVILIAGKGDEHVMVTNEGYIEWHDKTVTLNILNEIDNNKIIN